MFGSMERLKVGKKMSGWIHFLPFGTTKKRRGNNVLAETHNQNLFVLDWKEKVKKRHFFNDKNNPLYQHE